MAETLKGIQSGHRELAAVKIAVAEGWLLEISLQEDEEKALFEDLSLSLGLGESAGIAVAKVRGRREASLFGVPLTGTMGILCKAIRKKVITLGKGEIILRRMKEKGFYSPADSLKALL